MRGSERLRRHPGRRTPRGAAGEDSRGGTVLAGLGTGLLQGLVGGTFAALLFWALMVLALSEFSLENPVDLSVPMSSRVFASSFFVALSVFLYAVAGGTLLSPAFGRLVDRAVRGEP